MKTTIFVHTYFGDAKFTADTPEAAHKLLKSKLRKIKLSIKRLCYERETESPFTEDAGTLHILYNYATFDYQKAALLSAVAVKNQNSNVYTYHRKDSEVYQSKNGQPLVWFCAWSVAAQMLEI